MNTKTIHALVGAECPLTKTDQPLLFMPRLMRVLAGLLLLVTSTFASASTPQAAHATVEQTVGEILAALKGERAEILKDPTQVQSLVNKVLVPRVDFPRVARLTLGKHWKAASSEQREKFTLEYREYLVRFYSTALAEYAKDHEVPTEIIKVLPLGTQESDKYAVVRSEVSQPAGEPIAVDYRMYFADGEWKVIDVSVAGISMVKNYRSNFESEINRGGLDGLISKLASRNRELAAN